MASVAAVNGSGDDQWLNDAIAAEAAAAAQTPQQARASLDRALEGFRKADSAAPSGGQSLAGYARQAMEHPDLTPSERAQVTNVLERLGNAIMDGKIETNINSKFGADLKNLAEMAPTEGKYQGSIAQMTGAAKVLDRAALAKGTKLAYDPESGQNTRSSGLPELRTNAIDADLYFRTQDGALNITSTKFNAGTFADTVNKAVQAGSNEGTQLGRQAEWAGGGSAAEPRKLQFFMLNNTDGKTGFKDLMNDANLKELGKVISNPNERNIVIGDRAFSLNELKSLDTQLKAAAKTHVDGLRATAGDPSTFKAGPEYTKFYNETMSTPDAAMRAVGQIYGQKEPPLTSLAPTYQGGALWGAAGGAAVSVIQIAADGKLSLQSAQKLAVGTTLGAATGVATVAAVKTADRVIGSTVQQKATQLAQNVVQRGSSSSASTVTKAVASRIQGMGSASSAGASTEAAAAKAATTAVDNTSAVRGATAAAESTAGADAAGLAARTVAARVVGSTAVGALVSGGISAWDNRAGLVKGDSKAIGNVMADAAVGAVSFVAAAEAGAATGAAIGTAVPIPLVGTVAGAVVGTAVGVGVAYLAHASGLRQAAATGFSHVVDGVKSVGSSVVHAFSSLF